VTIDLRAEDDCIQSKVYVARRYVEVEESAGQRGRQDEWLQTAPRPPPDQHPRLLLHHRCLC